jgi:hypothetical protein
MTGFFDTPNATKASPQHAALATKLAGILLKANRISKAPSNAKWAVDLAKLETTDNIPLGRVAAVVDWLTTNIAHQYTPKVFSAESFRKKFLAIELAMSSGQTGEAASVQQSTTALKEAEILISHWGHRWPDGTDTASLPQAVAASLSNLRAFYEQVKVFRRGRTDTFAELAALVIQATGQPIDAAEAHWGYVHRGAWRWPNWGGKVLRWVWTTKNNHWRDEMATVSRDYCGRGVVFLNLLELLNAG